MLSFQTGEKEDFTDDAKMFMKHGVDNEKNAIATLVGMFLPLYYPYLSYYEEGAHKIAGHSGKDMFLVSPDGSVGRPQTPADVIHQQNLVCEVKCPYPNKHTTPVHYKIPERYIPQLLCEMKAIGVDTCIYLSWSRSSSTVFLVKFNQLLWDEIAAECEEIYGHVEGEKKKRRPKTLNIAFRKRVKELLDQFYIDDVSMLAEIPSLYANCEDREVVDEASPYESMNTNFSRLLDSHAEEVDIDIILNTTQTLVNNGYQLARKKATEVIVWLLSDVDREWKSEIPHSIPVAWCLKGNSLAVDMMRSMTEDVLQACYSGDINIACVCFDGAFASMAFRGKDGTPLTVLELIRSLWNEVKEIFKKKQKPIILRKIADITIDVSYEFPSKHTVVLLSKGNCLQKSVDVYRKAMQEKNTEFESLPRDCNVNDDLGYLPAEALDAVRLLKADADDDTEEMISSGNVHEISPEEEMELETIVSPLDGLLSVVDGSESCNASLRLDVDVQHLLLALQAVDKKEKWTKITPDILRERLNSAEGLQSMTVTELKIIIDHVNQVNQSVNWVKKSWDKKSIVNGLARVLGNGSQLSRSVRPNTTLKEQAVNSLLRIDHGKKAIPKVTLEAIYATLNFPNKLEEWKQTGPVSETTEIEGIGTTEWFAHAEYDKNRKQYEPKTLDAEHLLVNNRVFVTKKGTPHLNKKAWQDVAVKFPDVLSRATVFDLIDRQSCQRAKEVFSERVEAKMRELGYVNEADYCFIIRMWYDAEDEPGLSPVERCRRWLALKNYLLDGVNLTVFPPLGKYVKGLPRVQYEGFLQRIDIKIQLYAIIRAPYNQRSIGTLVNETFFGEITDMEPCKLGCPKAINMDRLLKNCIEIMHYRHNPEKRYVIIM